MEKNVFNQRELEVSSLKNSASSFNLNKTSFLYTESDEVTSFVKKSVIREFSVNGYGLNLI